jgi:hypothetical protein
MLDFFFVGLKSSSIVWKSEFFRFYFIIRSVDPDPDPDSPKSPDPDPDSMNMDPKHRFLPGKLLPHLGDTVYYI